MNLRRTLFNPEHTAANEMEEPGLVAGLLQSQNYRSTACAAEQTTARTENPTGPAWVKIHSHQLPPEESESIQKAAMGNCVSQRQLLSYNVSLILLH